MTPNHEGSPPSGDLPATGHALTRDSWSDHRRYYRIAGITIQVESDLPFAADTFDPKFETFEAAGPGEDTVTLHHHFSFDGLDLENLGEPIYRKPPWSIHRRGDTWVYLGIAPRPEELPLWSAATFSADHRHGQIHSRNTRFFLAGNAYSLTLYPTDQIWLARLLASRQGCYLHSAGAILSGQGLLFVGHSEAGKTTTVRMLQDRAEILCDDRNIVRQMPEGFRVWGSWSHGESPLVSAASAPLRAILFLKQAQDNRLILLPDRKDVMRRLLACVIKPFVTPDWWQKTLDVLEALAGEVPCYEMAFDKSGAIVDQLQALCELPAQEETGELLRAGR